MESAIKTVVSVYLKSAKGKENLSGKDFQSLVKNQLGNVLNNAESSQAVKDMQKGLDDNQDGKVSFQEYMKLIGYVADAVSQQYVAEQEEKNNGAAVTESEATPAANKAEEPAAVKVEESAADKAEEPAVEAGEGEAEKVEAAAEETAEEKTEEESS